MSKQILIILPWDPPRGAFTREMRCQEKKEVLGTLKPPLTPALLAALLHERGIPFTTLENQPAEHVARALHEQNVQPDLILFPTCTPTVVRDMEFIARVKQDTPVAAAAFGPHTSGLPGRPLEQFPQLDFAIMGEPEETVLELIAGKAPSEIPGLAFRDEQGRVVVNEKRPGVAELDALPFPAWDRFDISRFRVPLFGKKFLLVETSRGCPYGCGFCVVPLTHGGHVREKSPERIVEEIKYMKSRHGVQFFYFWGDTAVYRRETMETLCRMILEQGLDIEWISNTRPEAVGDPGFARILRKSGCLMLSMGAESADPEVLRAMGKKLDLQSMKNAVRVLRRAGIRSFVFFMFGYPGETKETMKKTGELALELDPDYANFYPVVPYPGTPLWRHCVENELLMSNDWARVDFTDYILRAPGLSPDEVLGAVRRARHRFYLRPRVVMRTLRDLSEPARIMDLLRAVPAYFDL